MLKDHGVDVVTCLENRSELSRTRANEAGLRSVVDYKALVEEVDLLLSILLPSEALTIARQVAEHLDSDSRRNPSYVDFNAVAPKTSVEICKVITNSGANFIDGAIIGGPPSKSSHPRMYVSGPHLEDVLDLANYGLDVRALGNEIGKASSLKMVYAASTKGTTALWTELLTAARALNVNEALENELNASKIYPSVTNSIPSMPRRSRRWVGEMHEIASTFESIGLTPHIFSGAADMYDLIGKTPSGELSSRDPDPTIEIILGQVIKALADQESS
jgi:3-hydroxyisobutyrate dehydrogenase-like beta-hydroxyacid dehydrogenase